LITRTLSVTLIFNFYAITPPIFKYLWNWCFFKSSNPQSLVQSLKLFPQTLLCFVRWLDSLQLKKVRKNLQNPWRWNKITQFTLNHWFPINEKVFNLKNKWKMRFGDSRKIKCKWLSGLGVTGIWVYIEKSGKCKNSPKNN